MSIRHFSLASLLAVALGGAAACGASAPPTVQMTKSQSAVRAAEEVGAQDTPKAALHLKMARDHIKNAEALMVEEEYEDATLVLRRAEADAELAIALSKEEKARADADTLMRKVQELKRDME